MFAPNGLHLNVVDLIVVDVIPCYEGHRSNAVVFRQLQSFRRITTLKSAQRRTTLAPRKLKRYFHQGVPDCRIVDLLQVMDSQLAVTESLERFDRGNECESAWS